MNDDIDLLNEPCSTLLDIVSLLLWDSSTPPSKEEAAYMLAVLQQRPEQCDELVHELQEYISTFGHE